VALAWCLAALLTRMYLDQPADLPLGGRVDHAVDEIGVLFSVSNPCCRS
jgi:hypothetical protein